MNRQKSAPADPHSPRAQAILKIMDERYASESGRIQGYAQKDEAIITSAVSRKDQGDVIDLAYPKKFFQRHAEFMSKGISIQIPDDVLDETKDDGAIDRIARELKILWNNNSIDYFIAKASLTASLYGDSFVHVFWDEAYEIPRLNHLHPSVVYPSFDPATGKIIDCFVVSAKRATGQNIMTYGQARAEQTVADYFRITYFCPTKFFSEDPDVIGYYRYTVEDNELSLAGTGVPMCPVIHLKNYIRTNSEYGESDIESMIHASVALNARGTAVSSIIDYQASPMFVFQGGKMNKNISRNPWDILETDKDTKVYAVEMKSDLSSSLAVMSFLKASMFELGHLPMGALGQATSTTATSYAAEFSVAADRCKVKESTYAKFYKYINEYFIRQMEVMDDDFKKFVSVLPARKRYITEITFAPALDRDESVELSNSDTRVKSGLSSRKQEMIRLGATATAAEQILNEFFDEQKALAEIEALGKPQPKDPSGNPRPKKQNPHSVGQKESISKG